jgi:hypothetical protein
MGPSSPRHLLLTVIAPAPHHAPTSDCTEEVLYTKSCAWRPSLAAPSTPKIRQLSAGKICVNKEKKYSSLISTFE